MNKWVAIFLSIAVVALTTLIIMDYRNNRPELIKRVEVKKNDSLKAIAKKPKDSPKPIIKYRPDPKTELELQKVKKELKSLQEAYAVASRQLKAAYKIIGQYQDFFKNNNFCVFNYKTRTFDHYGEDTTSKCFFQDGSKWIVREAKAFKEYATERLP